MWRSFKISVGLARIHFSMSADTSSQYAKYIRASQGHFNSTYIFVIITLDSPDRSRKSESTKMTMHSAYCLRHLSDLLTGHLSHVVPYETL
jgi:hypothetical protein